MSDPQAQPNPPLKNPYAPNAKEAPARKRTKADVIRMWAGGEHRRALDLARSLKLSDKDEAEVIEACPGWHELVEQR